MKTTPETVRRRRVRFDAVGPRTWLLATLAGWALLVCLLAVAGMGRQASTLALDPGQLAPVPAIRAPSTERRAPLSQYAQISARPLFSETRRAEPFLLSGQAWTAFDFVLTSVLVTPHLKMVILQSADGRESMRVKLGEATALHPDWRLTEVGARRAVFEGPGGRREMALRVFDGTGGQAPAALIAPAVMAPPMASGSDATAVPSNLAPGFAPQVEEPDVGPANQDLGESSTSAVIGSADGGYLQTLRSPPHPNAAVSPVALGQGSRCWTHDASQQV